MSHSSYYEINVSLKGEHYFATAQRSIGLDQGKLIQVIQKFRLAFPATEGYAMSVTLWDCAGHCQNLPSEGDFELPLFPITNDVPQVLAVDGNSLVGYAPGTTGYKKATGSWGI